MVIWLFGLSGAGKTTLARALQPALAARGVQSFVLDGDALREGLNRGLGFSAEDRRENIRRVAEVAKLFDAAGVTSIVSAITPRESLRALAREIVGEENFVDVFVECPLAECERRDVKGLYAKARRGEITGFTGVGDAFEVPARARLRLRTDLLSRDAAVAQIVAAVAGELLITASVAASVG